MYAPLDSLTHLRTATTFRPSTTTVKKPTKHNAVINTPISTTFSASKWATRLFSDFQFLLTTVLTTTTPPYAPPLSTPNAPFSSRYVPIPIDFYRVLGAEPHFLGDGIRRCYEARVLKAPQYGYSDDALVSRRFILQAACETLADWSTKREYNIGLADYELGTCY